MQNNVFAVFCGSKVMIDIFEIKGPDYIKIREKIIALFVENHVLIDFCG